jgi:hypothetical protein
MAVELYLQAKQKSERVKKMVKALKFPFLKKFDYSISK